MSIIVALVIIAVATYTYRSPLEIYDWNRIRSINGDDIIDTWICI